MPRPVILFVMFLVLFFFPCLFSHPHATNISYNIFQTFSSTQGPPRTGNRSLNREQYGKYVLMISCGRLLISRCESGSQSVGRKARCEMEDSAVVTYRFYGRLIQNGILNLISARDTVTLFYVFFFVRCPLSNVGFRETRCFVSWYYCSSLQMTGCHYTNIRELLI
jgi:hypothetical protein